MTDAFHKLPLTFDIERLQQDLSKLQHHNWQTHVNSRAHNGGWQALPLRSVAGEIDFASAVVMDVERYEDTMLLAACDYLPEVLASLQCPMLSARLMLLKAGDEIRPHTDVELAFEDGYVRLHVPIQTHPDIIFYINSEPVHFGTGECWYLNANYTHQVVNNTPVDRVHLVVDCVVNDRIRALFLDSGYKKQEVEYKYGAPGVTDDNVQQIIERLESLGSEHDIALAKRLKEAVLSVG